MNNNEFVLHPVASSAYFKQSEATESSGASNKFSDDCFEELWIPNFFYLCGQ